MKDKRNFISISSISTPLSSCALWMSTLVDVNFSRTKPILWYKLLAHDDDSRSTFPTTCECFFNKVLVADTALALVKTAPDYLQLKGVFGLFNQGHLRAMVVPFYFGISEVLLELLCLSMLQFLDRFQLSCGMFRQCFHWEWGNAVWIFLQ